VAAEVLSLADLKLFIKEWRTDLCLELSLDSAGFLGRRYPALAKSVPLMFPDPDVLLKYVAPLTSWSNGGHGPDLRVIQPRQPNLANLAIFTSNVFDWKTPVEVISNFHRVLWKGVCLRMLLEASHQIQMQIKTF